MHQKALISSVMRIHKGFSAEGETDGGGGGGGGGEKHVPIL